MLREEQTEGYIPLSANADIPLFKGDKSTPLQNHLHPTKTPHPFPMKRPNHNNHSAVMPP